jgi:NAD+ synthase
MASLIDQPMTEASSWLRLQPEEATAQIAATLRTQVFETLKRRGVVVAMSGGVDSSVCAALAVRAFGPKRVFGLFLPERDSDPISLALATIWADKLGIDHVTEDITPALDGLGAYRRRDEAITRVVPAFGPGWKS